MRSNPSRRVTLPLIVLILVGAYGLRVVHPDLHMTGADMPGHILASMRLHLTSVLNGFDELPTFVFQIVQFNHGYTTILVPYLQYEILFTGLGLPITETNLVFIHSFLGILSLLSIYYFAKLNFGYRVAVATLLIMALVPVHIGLSRAHIGQMIIQIIFFYSSLSFLFKYIQERRQKWKLLYFIATFLYIGSDNGFAIGLALQVLYAVFLYSGRPRCEKSVLIRELYLSTYSAIFVGVPVLMYLGVAAASYGFGIEGGYIQRLFGKSDGLGFSPDPLSVLRWSAQLIGPVMFFILVSLLLIKKSLINPQIRFLWIVFFVYLILLSSAELQRSYVIYLAPPVVMISIFTLHIFRRLSIVLITLTSAAMLMYSASVIYNVPIGISTTKTYGSVNHLVENNDFGIKTIGYLVRTDIIDVSKISNITKQNTGRSKASFDAAKDWFRPNYNKLGLFLDVELAEYYLGARIHNHVIRDIRGGELQNYDSFILAYIRDKDSDGNQYLLREVEKRDLNLIGLVTSGDHVLVELYSNRNVDNVGYYDVKMYNKAFDQRFGSLDDLPKTWLGHF